MARSFGRIAACRRCGRPWVHIYSHALHLPCVDPVAQSCARHDMVLVRFSRQIERRDKQAMESASRSDSTLGAESWWQGRLSEERDRNRRTKDDYHGAEKAKLYPEAHKTAAGSPISRGSLIRESSGESWQRAVSCWSISSSYPKFSRWGFRLFST